MADRKFSVDNCWCAYRTEAIDHDPVLLCLHGLGDSNLAFNELLAGDTSHFGVVAPDMPGYGASAAAAETGIGFDAYVDLLLQLLDRHCHGRLYLVAHSMGGAVGVLLARRAANRCRPTGWRLAGLINIEGNLTATDQFFSSQAVAKADFGAFESWFAKFRREITIRADKSENESLRRYRQSLAVSQPGAFLANSRELVNCSGDRPASELNEIAAAYLALTIPKIYCFGEANQTTATLEFLKAHHEPWHTFPGTGHSPMIDDPVSFRNLVCEFIGS